MSFNLPRDYSGAAIQAPATIRLTDGTDESSPRLATEDIETITIPAGSVAIVLRCSAPFHYGIDGELAAYMPGDEGIDYRIPCKALGALYVQAVAGVMDLFYVFEMLEESEEA